MDVVDWYLLGGLLLALPNVYFQAIFVLRLQEIRPDLYEELGRPSMVHNAGFGWMANKKFSTFFSDATSEDCGDDRLWALLRRARFFRTIFVLYVTGLLFVLLARLG